MKTYKTNGLFERVLFLPTRIIGCCLLLLLNGCHNSNAETPTAATGTPKEIKPRSMAIISDRMETKVDPERNSLFRCPDDMFMTGRHHKGDENDPTWYYCSKGTQFQPIKIINKTWLTLEFEHNFGYRQCAQNQVMTGREHQEDEEGKTRYECGTPVGFSGPMQVTPENPWIHIDSEKDSIFDCPENRVMVGRYHYGDEEGVTKYLCATLW